MNYQILARKWRPKNFSEVVGQKHILQTIKNSFLLNRIHQSWILSGTRGIGKTTIARLLSKSLSCINQITINPCEKCSHCQEIEQGCFPDLVEVDAASNTKIENMKELLDTMQYPPIKGRFKIYLIDEAHMLSKHSFNALLKTLEEPPKYIKFIFVTTEINKLPNTIISRCIYFHFNKPELKEIEKYLSNILNQERINFDQSAIKMISEESNGSIRDALNLTEQLISYGNKNIETSIVLEIFGILNKTKTLEIIIYILTKNHIKLMNILKIIYQKNIKIEKVLNNMIKILHNIAMIQKYPELYQNKEQSSYEKKILRISKFLTYEDLKSYYKIILLGKKELKFSPTQQIGIEMIILQLLNFKIKKILKNKIH
ncbi:DNA polymerase III subunit gamma/tau [Buchnera aphidicola]|uniref:DNA polymerase III subunit gamma/tau n=1 Tax=Buchnera aphidicola TaxID=9 RepID=UPI003464A282